MRHVDFVRGRGLDEFRIRAFDRLGAREPEVEDPHDSVVADHHVVRLEVAVDETRLVCGREPAPGRLEHGENLLDTPLFLRPGA